MVKQTKIIKKYKIGFCCSSGDYFELFKNIKKIKKKLFHV